jgi:hypothetical protein
MIAGTYYVRHAIPINDVSVDEIDSPTRAVRDSADHIEKHWVGGDDF